MRIQYIRLLTTNFTDMVDFYNKNLGLELTHRNDATKYAEHRTETSSIAIFSKENMADALGMEYEVGIHECQDKNMIVLYTEDFEDKIKQLRQKGLIFLNDVTEREEWGTKTVHLRDPDGNLIELYVSL